MGTRKRQPAPIGPPYEQANAAGRLMNTSQIHHRRDTQKQRPKEANACLIASRALMARLAIKTTIGASVMLDRSQSFCNLRTPQLAPMILGWGLSSSNLPRGNASVNRMLSQH